MAGHSAFKGHEILTQSLCSIPELPPSTAYEKIALTEKGGVFDIQDRQHRKERISNTYIQYVSCSGVSCKFSVELRELMCLILSCHALSAREQRNKTRGSMPCRRLFFPYVIQHAAGYILHSRQLAGRQFPRKHAV